MSDGRDREEDLFREEPEYGQERYEAGGGPGGQEAQGPPGIR
jgi:hypothetical protein